MWHRSHVPPVGRRAPIASYGDGLLVFVGRDDEALEHEIELDLETQLDRMDDAAFDMHGCGLS